MDVLLAEMAGGQLDEWRAFFELEPWGTPHEDLRFGYLLAQQHDMNRDRRRSRRLDPWDWLPSCRPEGPARGPSAREQVEIGRYWSARWRARAKG